MATLHKHKCKALGRSRQCQAFWTESGHWQNDLWWQEPGNLAKTWAKSWRACQLLEQTLLLLHLLCLYSVTLLPKPSTWNISLYRSLLLERTSKLIWYHGIWLAYLKSNSVIEQRHLWSNSSGTILAIVWESTKFSFKLPTRHRQ